MPPVQARGDRDVMPICRSYLFVPGNRPDRFAKGVSSGADAVILDLEDAVPAGEKVAARAQVAAWLSSDRPVYVRVNAFDTPWFADDVALCASEGVAGVVLPKAEDPEHVASVVAATSQWPGAGRLPVLPIVETALGLWHAERIARAPHVQRLVFGALDFALDLQLSGDESLTAYRSQIVLVSRVAGLVPPVDVPSTTFTDLDRVRAEAARSRAAGFGGRLCIHPAQIAPVHAAFAPSEHDVAWARRVLAADAASAGSATSLDGEMIDRPVVARAQAILARLGETR